MDRKGQEIVKFLLDWHYLLTEPPVDGSIPEIYFCFVCSVYSKGKDKVSWLQFMKYMRMIDKLCNGNTLVCTPQNALQQHYDDPFSCFDKITYINRLSLALLLRTSQSMAFTNTNSNNNKSLNNNNNSNKLPDLIQADDEESIKSSISDDLPTTPRSNSISSSPPSSAGSGEGSGPGSESYEIGINYANTVIEIDDSVINENYERKSLDKVQYNDIPKNKEDKLKYVLNLFEPEKPNISDNDIYPIKVITNKKLIPKSIDDTYTLTTKSNRLEQLEYLLETPCSSHSLQRERARLTTNIQPFYDCCEDVDHASLLSSLTTFDKNTSYCKINEEKLKRLLNNDSSNNNNSKINQRFQQLNKCIENKLHFIPIIQSQTDFKLGDCSYLDTCHKMSTCRYIHYGQLMPTIYNNKLKQSNDEKLNEEEEEELRISETIRIWDYTKNESICNYLKCNLPPQWINCDLMKLDFDVLGNDYGVVIADPSWTIHMNLNYSSLKDDELLSLRMDKLQNEGIFLLWVTGRTIETGREFLNKWGYKVINQITWIKTSQLIRTISTGRTGHWLNHSKEHLLVGIKGKNKLNEVKWINRSIDAQILISSTRETSRKPDEIYGIVDRLTGPGVKKLEIFGRQHNTRPGWLTVGNQLDGTNLVETSLINRYNKWLNSKSI